MLSLGLYTCVIIGMDAHPYTIADSPYMVPFFILKGRVEVLDNQLNALAALSEAPGLSPNYWAAHNWL